MWTPLQVFSNGYVYTDKFQLPLYNGIPNKVSCFGCNSYKAYFSYLHIAKHIAGYMMKYSKGRSYIKNAIFKWNAIVFLRVLSTIISLNLAT